MVCPFCGAENLKGAHECDACGQDLTAVEAGREPTGRLHGALLGVLGDMEVHPPLLVAPNDTVARAVALMREARHGSVLIQEDDLLVGIFTEWDLFHRVDPNSDLESIPVSDVMTRDPQTYQRENTLASAFHGMAVRGNRHLPIVDGEANLSGFVSVRGLLAHLRQKVGL